MNVNAAQVIRSDTQMQSRQAIQMKIVVLSNYFQEWAMGIPNILPSYYIFIFFYSIDRLPLAVVFSEKICGFQSKKKCGFPIQVFFCMERCKRPDK